MTENVNVWNSDYYFMQMHFLNLKKWKRDAACVKTSPETTDDLSRIAEHMQKNV